jgi:NAD(P)H-quinone oxidoreductase subunit 2
MLIEPNYIKDTLFGLLPEIIVIFSLIAIFIVELLTENSIWLSKIGITGLLLASIVLALQWVYPSFNISLPNYDINGFTIVFRCLITVSSTLSILVSEEYIKRSGMGIAEFLIFLLTATIGSLFLCGANDLITLFVALECLSLSSYLLAGYSKLDIRSNEASMKYLLMGSASSAILVYGFSWLYGISGGKLQLNELVTTLPTETYSYMAIVFAIVCILVGISFKLSIIPFHQWTPDVYEGSPTPVVAFFSVGSKIASFALAIRIVSIIFPAVQNIWEPILSILAILTMVGGNLIALTQTSMKRLLAYSSISQAGYIMIGIIYGNTVGYTSIALYMLIYVFMNIGAFACLIAIGLRTGTDQIRDYKGLYFRDPTLTICLSICLLSLAGIPPFAGFFTKLYLFWCGWQTGLYTIVLVGLVTSVISIYYYLRVIKIMISKEKSEASIYINKYESPHIYLIPRNSLELSIALCVVLSTTLGLFVNPLILTTSHTLANT